MLAWEDYNKLRKRRGKYKDTSKEDSANSLDNIICPRCKYQNHRIFIKKYGKCNYVDVF